MSQTGIELIAAAITDTPRQPARTEQTDPHAERFENHFAAFFPYAQAPVDPQPRAGGPADGRQRSGAVGAATATPRRQSRRGDA
jgi:hypothetical protein